MAGTLELTFDVEKSPELLAAIEALKRAAEISPDIRDVLVDLLLESGDSLPEGLIELRNVPTTRAGHLAIELHFSKRLCEIVAAASAGDVDRLRGYRVGD